MKPVVDLKRKLTQLGQGPPDREPTLAQLREQMAEIMQRRPADKQPLAPSPPPLDFVPWETSQGLVHRRTRYWSAKHWIGCVPVEAALNALVEYWALLGLDPKLADCEAQKALYLDTETTGLSAGAGVLAFLVGLAWFNDEEQLVLEQLLLRSPAEEPAQLEILTQRIEAASLLVTFNGKAFDWPLLVNRYVMNRLESPRIARHFDLLHVARRLHKPRMGRVNLKSLEVDVLALDRGPDIDGAEMGPRYTHFLRTFDEEALRPVVDHNAVDVLSMVALAGLYGEPLDRIDDADLVPLGRVFKRARDLEKARSVADRAMQLGGGTEAQRLRAELAKARGDRDGALADYAALCETVDDPKLRLELAKLYEHHAKQPERALEVLERGTGESDTDAARRKSRLKRKSRSARFR